MEGNIEKTPSIDAKEEPLLLFITVHFATALSTLIVYFERIKQITVGLIKQYPKDVSFL